LKADLHGNEFWIEGVELDTIRLEGNHMLSHLDEWAVSQRDHNFVFVGFHSARDRRKPFLGLSIGALNVNVVEAAAVWRRMHANFGSCQRPTGSNIEIQSALADRSCY
jgi:hypothetical protein